MSEYQQVKRRGPATNSSAASVPSSHKYATQYKNLLGMGFEASSIIKALDSSSGNQDSALSILIAEMRALSNTGSSTVISANDYTTQHKKLLEMGFDSTSVMKALISTSGNLEAATAVLLGEPLSEAQNSTGVSSESSSSKPPPPMKIVGKQQAQSLKSSVQKPDIKEIHNKFMATYKVQKCKDKNNHDKRMCIYWHTKNDRRRNPFDILYTCTECPNTTDTVICEQGDACLKAHNMLERMFHPELFKISMCQRGPNGSHCERGNLCAFAHSEEDHRIPLSHTLSKVATAGAAGSLATSSGATYSAVGAQGASVGSVAYSTNTETIQPGKAMSDSRLLDGIQEKLIKLIKNQGTEGIISSELPKRFSDVYSERLELTDEAGEKFRIKDLLLSHPCITVTMHKGVQPKYVYDETKTAATSSHIDVDCKSTSSVSTASSSSHINPLVNSSLVSSSTSYSAVVNQNSSNFTAISATTNTQKSNTAGDVTFPTSTEGMVARARRRGPTTTETLDSSTGVETYGLPSAIPPQTLQLNIDLPDYMKLSAAASPMSPSIFESEIDGSPLKNSNVFLSNGIISADDTMKSGGHPLYMIAPPLQRTHSGMSTSSNGQLLDYSLAVSGGGRRRGPDATMSTSASDDRSLIGLPSLQASPHSLNAPMQGLSMLSSPSAPTADFENRLSLANKSLASLSQQVTSLQNELTAKNIDYEDQAKKLKNALQILSESESKFNNFKDSMINEMHKTRMELDNAKKKLQENEDELSILRIKDAAFNRLKQEKMNDLINFRGSITQVENALIEAQRKESIYINEISLHDTINESSRVRDELTKFVTMIKNTLITKMKNESSTLSNLAFPNMNINATSMSMGMSMMNSAGGTNAVVSNNTSSLMGINVNGTTDSHSMVMGDTFGSPIRNAVANSNSSSQMFLNMQQQAGVPGPPTQSFLSAVSQQPPPSPFMMLKEEPKSELSLLGGLTHPHMGSSLGVPMDIDIVVNNNVMMGGGMNMGPLGQQVVSDEHVNLHGDSYHAQQQQQQDHALICSLPGCYKEGSYICSACGKAGYCGLDHQRDHWNLHMNECSIRL
mmetsp:Transcript_32388/g.46713  ORF Transcript_32388/g.46713 Transcript_32388/m.46713 type:complete len:1075 (+) Transcript_32388:110-3334(+)